nr:hypothetical protein CparaKRNrm1_p145 [Cryptomonas paramecium]
MEYLKKTFLSIEKFINNLSGKKKKYMIYSKFLKLKKKPNLQSYKNSIYSIVNNQRLYYILYTFGIYNFVYESYKGLKKKKIISFLDSLFILIKQKLFFLENIYLSLKKTNFNSYILAIKSFKTKYRIRFIKNKIKTNYKKSIVDVFVKLLAFWIKFFMIIYRTCQKTNAYNKLKIIESYISTMRKPVQFFWGKKNLEFTFFLNFSIIKNFRKKTKNFLNVYNFIRNKVKFRSLYQHIKFANFKKVRITHWRIDSYNVSCEKIFKNYKYDIVQDKNTNKTKLKLLYQYKKHVKTKTTRDIIFSYILLN